MDIQIEDREPVRILHLIGSIDASTAGAIQTLAVDQIAQGQIWIVIDLSRVEFMSSAGLRVFLSVLKECRGRGGDLYLAAAQPGVTKVLEISGFTSIMKIVDTVDKAVSNMMNEE